MNFKKSLLALFLIICILFTVTSVAAGEANDTAIASEDTIDDTISDIEQPAGEEISDDTLAAGESEEITASASDDDVLADDDYTVADVIFVERTGRYADNTKVYVKLVNHATREPIGLGEQILIHIINNKTKTDWIHGVDINYYGEGVLDWKETTQGAGDFVMKVEHDDIWHGLLINPSQAPITVYKNSIKITAKPLSAKCQSTSKFTINAVESDKSVAANVVLNFKIYNGKKWVSYKLKTNSNGVAIFNRVADLSPGKHNVIISVYGNGLTGNKVTTYINIVGKMSVIIKPTKLSELYKSKSYFRAKIINSKTKNPAIGVPISMIIDGKKKVSLTSDANGIVKYSTSKLNVANHKVVLKTKGNKFTGKAATSTIKIFKLAKGQKIKTVIKLTSRSVSRVTEEKVVRIIVTQNERGDWAYPEYKYVDYGVIKFTPVLKMFNGKNLNGEYTATLRYSGSSSGANSEYKNTFKGKFGQTRSYTGSVSLDDDLKYVQLIVQYKGNSIYGPSKYVSPWISV